MPNWLTKAKAAFKTPEPEPPEPFRLVCVCGGIFNGIRSEHEQRVRCSDCNHEMFVLPESVYPTPEVRYRGVIEVIDEDEVEVIEEPPASSDELPRGPADAISISPVKHHRKSSGKRKKRRGKREDRSDPESKTSLDKSIPAKAVEVDNVRGIRDRRKWRYKIFTPFRAIAAGILVASLLTSYVIVHSWSVANAEVVLSTSGNSGQEALDKGDLATANQEFAEVAKALETLGSDDPQSRQLHQLCLEVRAAVDLIPTSVPDMIAAAADASSPTAITSWQDNFDLTYRDKWVVIDTTVNNDDPESDVRISVPLMLEHDRAMFVIDGDWFAERLAGVGEQRVIFGARLKSCRAKGTTDRTWEISFADGTFFFWSDPRTYKLIGFPLDEAATEVLRQQSDMLGVSK